MPFLAGGAQSAGPQGRCTRTLPPGRLEPEHIFAGEPPSLSGPQFPHVEKYGVGLGLLSLGELASESFSKTQP